jgi:hypothetical protein
MSIRNRLKYDELQKFDLKLKRFLIVLYILTPISALFTLFLFSAIFTGSRTFFIALVSLSLNVCMYACIVLIDFARAQIAEIAERTTSENRTAK